MSAQVAHDLQDSFGISASTWEKQYRKATGYYLGSPIVSSNGEEEAVSTSLRFLIKTPGKAATVSHELSSGITYEWTEIGLWTQYRHEHSSILFCCVSDLCKTGFVDDVRAALTQSMPISLAHPFGWHAFMLPHISRAFHVAVWKCRDLIRDVEKRRPSAGKRPTDYYALHELSRHVLHSTETLSMAVEVTQSVIEDLQGFRGQHWLPQQDESVEKIIRCQKTLLQCERGRSEALAGRLRNEIDLVMPNLILFDTPVFNSHRAFHIGTQHDSLVASRISELARVDSASVKTISILGLVFLPGTFVSVKTSADRAYKILR